MQGNIEKRGNSFRLTINGGRDLNGKRIQYRRTVRTEDIYEAKKELQKFSAELEQGIYSIPKISNFAEYCDFWIINYAKEELSPTTLNTYKGLLNRIRNGLGSLKLHEIKPLHVTQFKNMLSADGIRRDGKKGKLSTSSILQHLRLISKMLQSAVDWELIPSNPARKVKFSKVKTKGEDCFTEDEVKIIFKKLEKEDPKYHAFFSLAFVTGARRGELLGLEWKNVDFKKRTIKIVQASKYTPTTGEFLGKPKTEQSEREICIPDSIVDLLQKYKSYQNQQRLALGDKWQDHDRLFVQWNGKPMGLTTPNHWFKKFLKKNNLPVRHLHCTRHTNATILISNGADYNTVAHNLGHVDESLILKIYGHATQKGKDKAKEIIEKIMTV